MQTLGPELDSQYTFGTQDVEEWVYNLSPGEAETRNSLGLTSQTERPKVNERVPLSLPPKVGRLHLRKEKVHLRLLTPPPTHMWVLTHRKETDAESPRLKSNRLDGCWASLGTLWK